MSKAKAKKHTKTAKPAPASAKVNRYRLTVAADKLAVLLRLPKTTIKVIDTMAKEAGNGSKRTSVIYGILGTHPQLAESMQALILNSQG